MAANKSWMTSLKRSVKMIDDEDNERPPSQESLGRDFLFAIIFSVVSVLITLAIAAWKSPREYLVGVEYAMWVIIPLFAYVTFLMQNTGEGCFILIFGGLWLGLASQMMPSHLLFPWISALVVPWFLTRIHRGFCD